MSGTPPIGALEAEIAAALHRACGLSLQATLRRHLVQRLGAAAEDLCARIRRGDSAALTELVEAAVVGETYFFRHPEQLAALSRLVFRPAPRETRLRLWSAGCASGEEAYSLAAALVEADRALGADHILATDVSARALAVAKAGRYGRWSLRRTAASDVRWLRPCGDGYAVVPEVRAAVELRRHNLLDPPPAGPFDVVVCRNVLIYFDAPRAREVLARLVSSLRPGGWLAIAPTELALAAGLPLEPHGDGGAVLLRHVPRATTRPGEPVAVPGARPARRRSCAPAALPPRVPAAEAPRAAPSAQVGSADALELVRLALAADARGDVAAALEALRRALYLDPDLAVAHATLVPLYHRAGRAGDAERARRNALRALEGMDDAALLPAAEPLTAGALRNALRPPAPAAPVAPGGLPWR